MFFLYDEPVTSQEIKELLLRSIIADDENIYDPDRAPVTDALLTAFANQTALEEDDPDPDLRCTADAAESLSLYKKVYFKTYPAAKGDEGLGWYPDTLPERGGIPRDIIVTAAAAIARRDRAKQATFADYYKKHQGASND